MIEAVKSAMAQYMLHFHAYPPDDDGQRQGSECVVYYLTTPFRTPEVIAELAEVDTDMAARMVPATSSCGPFLVVERMYLKNVDGDGNSSLVDSWGNEFRYEIVQETVKGPDREAHPETVTYRLWSVGANGIDERGKGDDVGLDPDEAAGRRQPPTPAKAPRR